MLREVSLIGYLPEYVGEYLEIQKIMTAENPEFQLYWDNIDIARDNMFPVTADSDGLARFEAMLSLTPQDDDTVEDRRTRVLAAYNSMNVYTLRGLEEMLSVLCGNDYSVSLEDGKYNLNVGIGVASIKQFNTIYQLLSNVVPCNINWKLFIYYNVHGLFNNSTHEWMSSYTHDELQKKKLFEMEYSTMQDLKNYTHGFMNDYSHNEVMELV